MTFDPFNPFVLALLGVGYFFVSAAMATMAGAIRNATERHNIIREARLRRFAYQQKLTDRAEQQKF